ncbi:hypothetical protein [Paraliomyxa miuraensis]|uniref:hypothetical protein n=1 Tax=Paraliomyxa miuraensis TaxID=376150 RepID=UPI00225C1D02|nr:hypothetical protein [Paraliomyxa miuraensis]MCX4246716.1 hypothetical protein [Paraliomyxa miuraensis]
MTRHWHTPAAIVVAGAMVAVAVYLALRRPEPEREPGDDRSADLAGPRVASHGSERPMSVERDERRRRDELDRLDARGTSTEPAPPSTPADRAGAIAGDPSMAVAGPLGMTPVSAALERQVIEDARKSFDDVRDRVRSECWDATQTPDAPDEVTVGLSLSFDAAGKVISSGVVENREATREGLATCLGPIIHTLEIPAPGANLSIVVDVAIP